MSAETATVSPTQRLAAYRPSSTEGAGYWIWIRSGGWLLGVEATTPRSIRQRAPPKPPALKSPQVSNRTSGIQLHPTSLPTGVLGRDAYAFVDWLAAAGQTWWQMLPLGPPDRWGSPYKAASAFAGWPGLLEKPRARVTKAEEDAFRKQHAYWVGDWERFA